MRPSPLLKEEKAMPRKKSPDPTKPARIKAEVRPEDGTHHGIDGFYTEEQAYAIYMLLSGFGSGDGPRPRERIVRKFDDAARAFLAAAKEYREAMAE